MRKLITFIVVLICLTADLCFHQSHISTWQYSSNVPDLCVYFSSFLNQAVYRICTVSSVKFFSDNTYFSKSKLPVTKNNNANCKTHLNLATHCGKSTFNSLWHCLHPFDLNAPFAVVTTNRAYQMSNTLGKGIHYATDISLNKQMEMCGWPRAMFLCVVYQNHHNTTHRCHIWCWVLWCVVC
jgi:hypothetical protein